MRIFSILVLATLMIPSLVACSAKGFSAAGGSVAQANLSSGAVDTDTSKNSSNNLNLPKAPLATVTLPTLKLGDAVTLSTLVNQLLAEIGLRLQGISGGSFSFSSNTVSTNLVFKCSLGGTVSMKSQASISADIRLTSITVGLYNGTGSLVFAQCKVPQVGGAPLQMDGTLAVNSFEGTMKASLGLTTGIHSINALGGSDVSGNLVMTTGEVVKTCAVDVARDSEVNSTIDIFDGFKTSGQILSAAQIKVCDFDFNRSFNLNY